MNMSLETTVVKTETVEVYIKIEPEDVCEVETVGIGVEKETDGADLCNHQVKKEHVLEADVPPAVSVREAGASLEKTAQKPKNADEKEVLPCDLVFTEHVCIKVEAEFVGAESEEGEKSCENGTEQARGSETKRLLEQQQDKGLLPECDTRAAVPAARKTHTPGSAKPHTGEKTYFCDICKKKFAQLSDLNKHKKIHTGEKPFHCKTCEKRFRLLSQLQVHERTHTGEKPYPCGMCDKRFTQLSHLNAHERRHIGEKPHACKTCEKRFSEMYDLKKHEIIHTGEKPYSCGTCEKEFAKLEYLKRHERFHTGEKPYCCAICKKQFSDAGNFKKHERVHTGEKPYSCCVCKKEFADSSYLRKHERNHMKERRV